MEETFQEPDGIIPWPKNLQSDTWFVHSRKQDILGYAMELENAHPKPYYYTYTIERQGLTYCTNSMHKDATRIIQQITGYINMEHEDDEQYMWKYLTFLSHNDLKTLWPHESKEPIRP